MSDYKSTRLVDLPSYSNGGAANESKPSAPYINYDPPPSYEESLHHPVVAGNCNQKAGNLPAQHSAHLNYVPNVYNHNKEAASQYPKQSQSSVYPQQSTQFNGHLNMVPGLQLNMQSPFYPGQQVVIPNVFDAGARFNSIAPPSIPPPPPGIAPNAAQMAVQQGATVVTSQKKSSFLSGEKGAGFTFW